MLSGWDFFKIHHALKLHFTSESYDVMKYNGKMRLNYESFQHRNDKLRYDSFAHKLIGKHKAGQFCIANIVHGSPNFVYEQYEDAYEVYLQWKRVRESMTREFEKDVNYINKLVTARPDLDVFSKTKNGNNPPLLQVVLGGKIHVETVVILNTAYKDFFDSWASICDNDPYVSKTLLKWKKYTPFVAYDADKIKSVLIGAKF